MSSSPLETGDRGVRQRAGRRPRAVVVHESRIEQPDLRRGQADARRGVHRLDHVVGERARALVEPLDLARPAAAARGRRAVRMGWIVTAAYGSSWSVRTRPAPKTTGAARPRPGRRRRAPASSRIARPNRGTSPGPNGDQAYRSSPTPTASRVTGAGLRQRGFELGGSRSRGRPGAPAGTRPPPAAGRPRSGTGPGFPATRAWTGGSPGAVRLDDPPGPRGPAHAAASIHVARDLLAGGEPGRRAARSGVQHRRRGRAGGGTSFTASGPPTTMPSPGPSRRGRDAGQSSTRPGPATSSVGNAAPIATRGPLLDPFGAPALHPEPVPAAVRAAARRPAHARSGTAPPSMPRVPPHAAHRAGARRSGRRAPPRTRGGSTGTRGGAARGPDQPRRAALGAGRTASTSGPGPAGRGDRRSLRSPSASTVGHSDASTHAAPSIARPGRGDVPTWQ